MRHLLLFHAAFLFALAAGCGDTNDDSSKTAAVHGDSSKIAATDELARRINNGMPRHVGVIGGPDFDPQSAGAYFEHHGVDPKKLQASALVLLQSADVGDREGAARLLGLMKDGAALEPLLNRLEKDTDESARIAVVKALHHFGPSPETKNGLIKALSDKSPLVRTRVLRELGHNSQYQAVSHIRPVMKADPVAAVRVIAAKGLVYLSESDDAVVSVFEKFLIEKSLREECEEALERLGKLKLPLPEECYCPIDREGYQKILCDLGKAKERGLRVSRIERSVKSNSKIFFELLEVESVCPELPPPTVRRWFVVPAE
jgi:HEAT repeats